ncbi:hypothetical protein [Paractinoplanes atraurantiacus]|uniref:hypothetical protein n=1 Tax=Paractinoplanes atraurantiacus TaxID=1036182 RepID=UPI0015CF5867|nr:hypothetical protein [Actinoplanes atraurantiacus]
MLLPPLPAEPAALLDELGAPPRLVAHLRLVHDPEELSVPGHRHEAAGHQLFLARGTAENKARFQFSASRKAPENSPDIRS